MSPCFYLRATALALTLALVTSTGLTGCESATSPASIDDPNGATEPAEPTEPTEPTTLEPGEIGTAASGLSRDMAPSVSGDDQEALVAGNSAFAFDLYHALDLGEGDNAFLSPLSISTALAMTYAGAEGTSESQMREVLHYDLAEPDLHAAFNWLDLELNSRGEDAEGLDGDPFRLSVFNALWGQVGYLFLPEFLDTLALHYGAGMTLLDFIADPNAARLAINDWVAEQTEDCILDLLQEPDVTKATRLVLTNAIYFNASWDKGFPDHQTSDAPFHRLDGSEVTVPTMHDTEVHGYAEGEGYQALEMLYDGGELSMVVVLPAAGTFPAFEDTLDSVALAEIFAALEPQEVGISLPKFQVTMRSALSELLKGLGMTDPFVFGPADFSGMDGSTNLYISEVIHKAFVSVCEEGTEAAAATAVVMDFGMAGPAGIEFDADRPFLFFIRDIPTDTVVFMGRVVDPSATE